jgi:hypothetical protein
MPAKNEDTGITFPIASASNRIVEDRKSKKLSEIGSKLP